MMSNQKYHNVYSSEDWAKSIYSEMLQKEHQRVEIVVAQSRRLYCK